MEKLQNLHFADNLQKLPPKESESFDRAWKHRPFFNHLVKHFQEAVLPELHQSIDEHMCKFKGKSLMHQYMKNKPIKWGLKFGFGVVPRLSICINLICIWEKRSKTEFGLGESVVLCLCENLKYGYCDVFFDNFLTSPNLMLKPFEDGICATGTNRSNRKHMHTLKANEQMKRGERDWLACDTISATKWMDNRSGILLPNYYNPSVAQEINGRVKGSKEKVKVSCPVVFRAYNTYMEGVDPCDQMKVSYEVDQRNKVRFYLRVFFDFLGISIVNSKIVHDKTQSDTAVSSMDFRFSLVH